MVSLMIDYISDIVATILSIGLVLMERLLTGITLLLPEAVLDMFGNSIKEYVPRSAEQISLENDKEAYARVTEVMDAMSFVELCEIFGYMAEEHVAATSDGYLLGIHRIRPRGDVDSRADSNGFKLPKPVVYLHHGLLMNSEVWVAVPDKKMSIAFQLVDAGYDVWLGNNRGNKYSKKHLLYNSNSAEFWNFGLDEFALYDIPTTIDYILSAEVTGARSLAYIGFSQGSAQAFAALSTQPILNSKIHVFIALGPAMAPPGINPIVQSLMNASPSLLYMTFGHRIILRSTTFWQSIMIPTLFIQAIDFSLNQLFRWKGKNISWAQRMTGYSHLYSYTSVKSVVHWFQIIKSQSFQMYDDDTFGPFSSSRYRYCRVPPYPTKNISTKIEIIYGTSDTILDIKSLLQSLPQDRVSVTPVDNYEHLEMIWGDAIPTIIAPKILDILSEYKQGPVKHLHLSNGKKSSKFALSGHRKHR